MTRARVNVPESARLTARECAICGGSGRLGDTDETPCPAGCEPCRRCGGAGFTVVAGCFAIDALDCCGGYCEDDKEPCSCR